MGARLGPFHNEQPRALRGLLCRERLTSRLGQTLLLPQASGHRGLRAEASLKGVRSCPEVRGQVEEASAHVKRSSKPRRAPPPSAASGPLPAPSPSLQRAALRPQTVFPASGGDGPPPIGRAGLLWPAPTRPPLSPGPWSGPSPGGVCPLLFIGPHPTRPPRPSQCRRGMNVPSPLPGAPTVRREAEAASTPRVLRGVLQTQSEDVTRVFTESQRARLPTCHHERRWDARDHEVNTREAQGPRPRSAATHFRPLTGEQLHPFA